MKARAKWREARVGALCAILLLFSLSAEANDLGDFIGRRVVRVNIEIEGAPGSSIGELQYLLEVSVNQEYSPVRIHDSLVRLHKSGLISAARVEAEAVGADGVALRFVVRPQARVDSVVFEGETVFPSGELRSRLNELDPGDKLSPGAVTRGLAELQAFYSSRGYLQARINSDIRLDGTGTRATVVYVINAGQQARVSKYKINIQGAQIDLSKPPAKIVEGQPFAQTLVGEEMERIRQLYLKENYLAVRLDNIVTPEQEANTVAVTINVEAGPRITVEVEGLKELDEKKKREILPFYTQAGVDDFSIEEGRRRLQEFAQQKGYFFAEVTRPEPPDIAAPTATIKYVVEPGRRYKLSDIEIEGLDAIPSAELQAQMKSKVASFIPFFGLGRGVTSNDMLRQDSNVILKRLREIGYRRAQVEVRRGVSVTGEDLIITFNVEQGPRTYVEEVGIRGNNVLTTDQLRGEIKIEQNNPLITTEVTQSANQLLSTYNTQGYATAEVVSELVDLGSFDGQDRVQLVYNVAEGPRVRIRNVVTRGTARTKAERLERDFYLFKEGDWLRTDLLQETERVLYDTDAFTSVQITSESVGRTANGTEEHDVTVNLVEAKPYLLVYGFGYQTTESDKTVPGLSSLNGVRGLVQLTNVNMFGKLYTGSTQLRVSQNELLGAISFQNPRPFGHNYPTLISLFARRLAEKTFNSDRYTAVIQTERRLSEQTIVYASYNFERISNYNIDGDEEDLERNRQSVRLGRIGPSFARDTRNNAFDPSTGTFTIGSFYVASTIFGGNEQFVKLLAEHSRYYPIKRFRETVYTVSGRLGLASPFGGKQTLPISERFFAGGARDLRGLGFEEAGPRDSRGRVTGGNAVFIINNELRFPIWRIFGGAVFSDTGNVFRRVKDFRPQDLTQTIGFGFRVKTPIGPVRLDVGYLVFNKPEGSRTPRFHFSIGQTF
ncbi:MAG TPA: POTRA domain-containing protein [Blastocatellia bacterium]|nr:POTRA domain-containing protein [Blastocatellia bacterium]